MISDWILIFFFTDLLAQLQPNLLYKKLSWKSQAVPDTIQIKNSSDREQSYLLKLDIARQEFTARLIDEVPILVRTFEFDPDADYAEISALLTGFTAEARQDSKANMVNHNPFLVMHHHVDKLRDSFIKLHS